MIGMINVRFENHSLASHSKHKTAAKVLANGSAL